MTRKRRIACFVSPHGYGHATRLAAVIDALQSLDQDLEFDVYSKAPPRLFEDSLDHPIAHFDLKTDIGLVQATPLLEDLPGTLQQLDEFYPLDGHTIGDMARVLTERACTMALCDISPLGIVAARTAGIPSVLIENFTWDWIYQGYVDTNPEFLVHISYLRELHAGADYHIKAEPACSDKPGDKTVRPIARRARKPVEEVRKALGVLSDSKLVLVTMGGTPTEWSCAGDLGDWEKTVFVVPTGGEKLERAGNVVRLPSLSGFYHPDLVNAADVVISKLGYSTVAEVYWSGVPLGYVPRARFRESACLERFVCQNMRSLPIRAEEFDRNDWADVLTRLIALPREAPAGTDGASEVGEFLLEILA